MNNVDRVIRILLSVLFFVLFFTQTVTGIWGIVLLVLGGIFLGTAVLRFCPIYAMFGLSSRAVKEAEK